MFEAPEKISRGLKHSHSHHSHLEEDVSTLKNLPVRELAFGSNPAKNCLIRR